MAYPNPDTTSVGYNIKRNLFPAGVDSFAQDFDNIENLREAEEIVRFNSMVKSPGIVSKKLTESDRDNYSKNLFPIGVSANSIIITKGTGFTKNGARIFVPVNLTITASTTPGFQDPTAVSGNVLLCLKRVNVDSVPRTHPITGVTHNMRRDIDGNTIGVNGIVLFINEADVTAITNNDVIVLGRMTNNGQTSTAQFDTSEATGGRVILRMTEGLTCETTGFVLEGDIDFNNIYNGKNVPKMGSTYWNINSASSNSDLKKVFAKTNYNLNILRSVKFTKSGSDYGLEIPETTTTKMLILPHQKPPSKIILNGSATRGTGQIFIPLGINKLFYIRLSDDEMGVGATNLGDLTLYLDNRGLFTDTSTDFANDLNKFAICYNDNNERLIFANGLVLNLYEYIDSVGKYSGYVRTDGETEMTGDFYMNKEAPYIFMKNSDNAMDSGWKIMDASNVNIASFNLSHNSEGSTTTLTHKNSSNSTIATYQFTSDGRIKISGIPVDADDVIDLGYFQNISDDSTSGFVRRSGDTMNGALLIKNELTVGEYDVYRNVGVYGNLLIRKDSNDDNGGLIVYGNSSVYGTGMFYNNTTVGQLTTPKFFDTYGDIRVYKDVNGDYGNLFVENSLQLQDQQFSTYKNYIDSTGTQLFSTVYINNTESPYKNAVINKTDSTTQSFTDVVISTPFTATKITGLSCTNGAVHQGNSFLVHSRVYMEIDVGGSPNNTSYLSFSLIDYADTVIYDTFYTTITADTTASIKHSVDFNTVFKDRPDLRGKVFGIKVGNITSGNVVRFTIKNTFSKMSCITLN